jgi:hypothetical protein
MATSETSCYYGVAIIFEGGAGEFERDDIDTLTIVRYEPRSPGLLVPGSFAPQVT